MPHRKPIVITAVNSQLSLEIIELIELMRSIEVFVVLAMGTFNLTIMSGREGSDELVADTTLFERSLKQCGEIRIAPNRLVNSNPLSVCTLSTLKGNAFSIFSRNNFEV